MHRAISEVDSTLRDAGYESYLVGGCVRDLLLGISVHDFDFTTNARPADVKRLFRRTVDVGARFGTILVLIGRFRFEVTTYRTETNYSDGRRPDSIEFGDSLAGDVLRRDFTINGLAYDFRNSEIIDFCEGMQDLQSGIIRTIGDPVQRFREDGLRPVRGCRFAAALGFRIEDETFRAMTVCRDTVALVARERFTDEMRKTLKYQRRFVFWQMLRNADLLRVLIPHFTTLVSGSSEAWTRLESLCNGRIREMAVYFAVLLEAENSDDPRRLLADLRLPVKTSNLAMALLNSPWEGIMPGSGNAAVKSALSETKRTWPCHIRFMLLKYPERSAMPRRVRDVIRLGEPVFTDELALKGDEIAAAGFSGPLIGKAIRFLLSQVHENPMLNNPHDLRQLLQEFRP